MKIKLSTNHLLFLIIFVALFVRIFQLGSNPRILNRDEAALAYNAFLLKESSADEWQNRWPLTFKSFGDYKLPGYIYTLFPLFLIFNETDFLVRLPTAIAGTVIVILVYLISLKLFNKKFALLAALLITLSPVMIFYSRMAWEATLGLMWSLIAIYLFFFYPLNKNQIINISDIVGVVAVILSILTYNAPFLYLPIIIFLVVVFRRSNSAKSWWSLTVMLCLIVLIGFYLLISLTAQKSGITLFTDPTTWHEYTLYRSRLSGISLVFFGSQYFYWLRAIVQNLVSSFSYRFLVTRGGAHPWHQVPGTGHLLWSVYFLGLIGIAHVIISLIKKAFVNYKKVLTDHKLILFLLLFTGLIPAIITIDAPHATRSLLFLLIFQIFAVYGVQLLIQVLPYKKIILPIIIGIILFESSIYLNQYFFKYPSRQSALKPGFYEVLKKVDQKYPNSEITIEADAYQYILASWYQRIPSDVFFQTVERKEPDIIGLYYVSQVGNYSFVEDKSLVSKSDILVFWDHNSQQWFYKKAH